MIKLFVAAMLALSVAACTGYQAPDHPGGPGPGGVEQSQ